MGKVSINWTIDMELAVEITQRAKNSGKKVSFVANSLLRSAIDSQKKASLVVCEVCGAEHAKSIECPNCLKIRNQKEMDRINKVLEEKDLKKEKELKAKEDEIKKERINALKTRLARRKVNLKIAQDKGNKEQIELDTKVIQKIEKELM